MGPSSPVPPRSDGRILPPLDKRKWIIFIFIYQNHHHHQPEIVPERGLAGVEDNVVPHILTTERSQHGKEEIENPAKFYK